MGSARYIGRIGGLAVALGVGLAVAASPGIAWADDPGSASSENAGSVGASDTDGPAESEGTRPGREVDDSADEESGADDPAEPESEPVVDSAAEDNEASDTAGESDRPRNRKPRWARAATDADSDTKAPAPLGLEAPVRQRAVVDRVLEQPAAPRSAATVSTSPSAPPPPDVIAHQEVSVIPAESTPPTSMRRMTVALPATGSGPSVTDGPLLPVDAPVEWALAAWGTRQRPAALTGGSVENGQTLAATTAAASVPGQPIGIPDPVTGVVTGTVVATDPESDALTFTLATEPDGGKVELNAQTGAYTYTPTQATRLAAGATTATDTDTFNVSVGDGQQTSTAVVTVYIAPARLDTKPPIAVGTRPSAMAVTSDGRMFVANTGGNTVSVINTVTGQRVDASSSIFSKDIAVGSAPGALALSADGLRLYVANAGDRSVSVIDTATYKRIDANPSIFSTRIAVGASPSALVSVGNRLYVANRGSNTVSVIDTTTNKLVDINPNVSGNQAISVGSAPSALVAVGNRLYVANRSSNSVSVIDTATNSVTTTIAVGAQPSSLALGTNGRLYVVNTGSGTVSVINTGTNALAPFDPNGLGANPMPVGSSPSSVALSPLGDLAYVVNGDDTISVIDTEASRVIRTVAFDSDPSGDHVVTVSPNGTVFVTDAADNTVRVLSVAPGTAASAGGTGVNLLGDDVTVTGYPPPAEPIVNADGTRALLITPVINSTTLVTKAAVINTATGKQAGATLTLPGLAVSTMLTADGTRALIITSTPNTTTGIDTTRVTVVNMTTGAPMPGALTFVGYPTGVELLGTHNGRVLITTDEGDAGTGYVTRLAVINTVTGVQVGTTVSLLGRAYETQILGVDAGRALVTTYYGDAATGYGTRLAVINTVTGVQVGAGLSVDGYVAGTQLLGVDAGRALVTTYDGDAATGYVTRLAVINTVTGVQVGAGLSVDGYAAGTQLLGVDAGRALVTTYDGDAATGYVTRLAVINTVSGIQTGATASLLGKAYETQLVGVDAGRALVTTYDGDAATGYVTRLAVINTVTGVQVGAGLSVDGYAAGTQLLGVDAGRALVTTYDGDAGAGDVTRLAVINTVTGMQAGNTVNLLGKAFDTQLLGTGGSRIMVTTQAYDSLYDSSTFTVRLAVVDTATGTQLGTTFSLNGAPWGGPVVSADGTRALITTQVAPPYEWNPNIKRVALINIPTGTQVGTTLSGGDVSARFSADGTRVLFTAFDREAVITTAAVINSSTGAKVGATLTLPGEMTDVVSTPDGSRAAITSRHYDSATRHFVTLVALINTATGTQVGTTLSLAGESSGPAFLQFTADASHLVISTPLYSSGGNSIDKDMRITVISMTDGKQMGLGLVLPGGYVTGPPMLTAGGSRLLLLTDVFDGAARTYSARVAVLDIATGTQIGTTLIFGDRITYRPVLLSANGTHALLAYTTTSIFGFSTRLVVVNTLTGTQTGSLIVSGGLVREPRISADGTRAFVATGVYNSRTSVTTRIAILQIV